jgi:hypothetical protein
MWRLKKLFQKLSNELYQIKLSRNKDKFDSVNLFFRMKQDLE